MVKTHIIDLTCLDTFFFVCINVRFCAIKVFMVEDAQNRCILSCWQHLFLNLLIEYQCHSPDVMNGIETHTFLKHVTCATLLYLTRLLTNDKNCILPICVQPKTSGHRDTCWLNN